LGFLHGGTTPLILFPSVPIGFLITAVIILNIRYKPNNIFLCISIPFFLAHTFIGHKEERFLFPIVYFIPFFICSGYQILNSKYILNTLTLNLLKLNVIFNIVGLSIIMFKPADIGLVYFSKLIRDKYLGQNILLYHTPKSNPYNPFDATGISFYKKN